MSRRKENLVEVAVMAAIHGPLTYRVPPALELRAGQRVTVPLGPRKVTGIVLEPVARMAPGVKLRDIFAVLDPEPLLSPELLTLGLWIAEYYLAPVGEVFRAMLPLLPVARRVRLVSLTAAGRGKLDELGGALLEEQRAGEDATLLRHLAAHSQSPLEGARLRFPAGAIDRALRQGWVEITEEQRRRGRREVLSVRLAGTAFGPMPDGAPRLSPVAKRIIEALAGAATIEDHRQLLKQTHGTLAHLKKLSGAGVIELAPGRPKSEIGTWKLEIGNAASAATPSLPVLTPGQSRVLDDLNARLKRHTFSTLLLHGVTGSGKTEIYLRLVERALSLGRSALVLVPEIALTPAMQSQVFARFGDQAALFHSGLGRAERHDTWWRVRRGEARVVLGTRSAVFAPLTNLGVVIVDEEHESSYKQEEMPRYHGRDAAVVRARLAGALAVLGSATPSLESYWNAQQGKYALATLPERIAGRPLAAVEIVDMREEFRRTFFKIPVSRRLQEEIEVQLRNHAQTLILLNRRGYSWFLLCRSCGETQRCINCSISLTYHRREHRLLCHYCGYSTEVPKRCPACDSEFLQYVGEGTEKIEDKFRELFPAARVERLDRDAARRAGHYAKVLSTFQGGEIDILIGTQLISKGHDFPGVTLVGVVSADQGLALPDFRAAERTFQLLTQVAGRSGRGEAPGRVLVQSFYPEHYAIRLASEQNYEGFFSKEMRFRRMMHYPPVTALANIIAQHTKPERAAAIAREMNGFLEAQAAGDARHRIKVIGPSPAPLARIEGRFRIQFLIKAASRALLNQVLRRLAAHCDAQGIAPQSVMIDMDPVSIM
ncbi:MAG TPA: primosomal protein N' [Terriglobia bacterium]|nr:primosomal protein N' [Terriglobia bacterium]